MALVSRFFEWFQHFLGSPGGPGAGPRDVLDVLVPVVPGFGTGRLTRRNTENDLVSVNASEAVGEAPEGNEVFFVFACHYLHVTALSTPDLHLTLRQQIGVDFDVAIDDEKLGAADGQIFALKRPILVPGDLRLVLKSSAAVDLRLSYHFLRMSLGETSWWP